MKGCLMSQTTLEIALESAAAARVTLHNFPLLSTYLSSRTRLPYLEGGLEIMVHLLLCLLVQVQVAALLIQGIKLSRNRNHALRSPAPESFILLEHIPLPSYRITLFRGI